MASVTQLPNGELSIGGNYGCVDHDFLTSRSNPLGALREILTVQRLISTERMTKYSDANRTVDRHMPMRGSTADRIDGVVDYRVEVGYDGLSNQRRMKNVTPSTSGFNVPRTLLDKCQDPRSVNIGSRANLNSFMCNPVIDGPMPILGSENYGREAFTHTLPIPPMCFGDYANKDGFAKALSDILTGAQEAVGYLFALGQIDWMTTKSRFNAVPYAEAQGDGNVKLPVDAALFSSGTFGRVPNHYGSADWIAGMLRESELPPDEDLDVMLPMSIFRRYRDQLIRELGINIMDGVSGLTSAVNSFYRDISPDGATLVFRDEVSGRKINFMVDRNPVYIEVDEQTTAGGEWFFQEKWITRNSETAGQQMFRANPAYGVGCSCPGRVLSALIVVTPSNSGRKPFYKEPFPANNPSASTRALIKQYAGPDAKINTTLAEFFSATVSTTIYTGAEAQLYVLQPLNQRYRDQGATCDLANNYKNAHMGGFVEISGVFVENDPRKLVMFLLRVPPPMNNCVPAVPACNDPSVIPAAGAFDAGEIYELVPPLLVPPPPEPPEPAAGTILTPKSITVKANCTGNKTVSIKFRRVGGTAGAISLNIGGTPSAHVTGGLPASVSFADGEITKTVTFNILPWPTATQEVETFNLTFSGGQIDPTAFTTAPVCIKSNTACPADCLADAGCSTCG